MEFLLKLVNIFFNILAIFASQKLGNCKNIPHEIKPKLIFSFT